MAIWNKYPYTDFHELNADYVFTWIKNAQDFIDEFTAKVNQNTADIVSLKTRMTTAEGDISGLKTRMTNAEGRLTTVENALITDGAAIDALEAAVSDVNDDIDRIDACALMNSTQIEGVASPRSTATKVTLQFESERYSNGAAAAGGTVDLDLPQATQQAAGTMNAADKTKVDCLAVSGDIDQHDETLQVVASNGLAVDNVDDTNPDAVPSLRYLKSDRGIETVEIFDGDMSVQAAQAAIDQSAFAQNTNGTLLYMQRGGQKAFYFDASNAELVTAVTDTDDILVVSIPATCRPSRRYSWVRRCIDENDGVYGEIDIRYETTGYLIIRYLGSVSVPGSTGLLINGWYLPFM